MRKILSIIILLLVLSAITAAGVFYAHKTSESDEIDRAIEEMEPEIESLVMQGAGGLFYHNFTIKVYSDVFGYHLYYNNGVDFEKKYDLTKTEYLICTNLSHEEVNNMIDSSGVRGSDLILYEISVKFKGEDEISIPAKAYLYFPFPTLTYFVDLKSASDYDGNRLWYGGDLTNRHFPAVCESIEKYLLVHDVAYSNLHYSFTGENYSNDGSGSVVKGDLDYQFPKGIRTEDNDFFYISKVSDSEEKISRLKESGYELITSGGSEAYFKTVQDENCIAFFISFPYDYENICFFSEVPADVEAEDFIKYVKKVL